MKGTISLKMRIQNTVAVSAALALALLAGASALCLPIAASAQGVAAPAPSGISEGVVAIVNDEVISSYDLSQRVLLLIATSGIRPTQQNMPQIQQEALRSLVDEHLEVDEIKREEKEQKFTIMADDAEIDDYVSHIAQASHITADQLYAQLAAVGVGKQTLREQIRAQRSWQHWIQGRYGGSRLKIGQDQINAAMATMEADAAKPHYAISEIFIDPARVGGVPAAIDGAKQLIAQMQQGVPFAAVAQKFSSASTAANGGDAGWLTESSMPPEVRDAVVQMRTGQLSVPIVTRDGVYIIQLRDKRAGSDSTIVQLKQAAFGLPADATDASVEAARQKMAALRGKITKCDEVEPQAAKVEGVVAGDLGEADVKDLAPAFQQAIANMKVGQVSEPVRTSAGWHLIALCGKHQSGINLPSRDDMEARIEDQQLDMISRRYMRDLRSSLLSPGSWRASEAR